MKTLYLILLSIFILTGCSQKEIVVQPKQVEPIAQKKSEASEEISYEYIEHVPAIEEDFIDDGDMKFAIVFPSKIVGKYGNSTINTVMGYLLYQNKQFEIESFDSEDESYESITRVLEKVESKGYKKVIALFTKNAMNVVSDMESLTSMRIYFPLIEKNDVQLYELSKNFIYGAISYENQMKELLYYTNNLDSMIYEESGIGFRLKSIYDRLIIDPVLSKEIKLMNNRYKDIVNNPNLKYSTLMLNTPIIKTSILLSQLRAFDIETGTILSTQLNYNPLLVQLTQYEDRVNFILANSIEETDYKLKEVLDLLDTDITYNWVNYSSLVGINYLFAQNQTGLIKNQIVDGVVQYNTKLYSSTKSGFKKIERVIPDESIIELVE